MKNIFYCIVVLLLLNSPLLFASSSTKVQQIIVWDQLLTHPNSMVAELLKRVFQVTLEEFGPYRFVPSESMEQGRAIRQMELKGNLDIALFAPNEKRRNSALAIPIPVTGSLLGYRICLIRKGEQGRFNGVKNLEGFINNELLIGQHQTWSDTNILRSNGLSLWTTYKYRLLFAQLVNQRFDCFSRGANEVLQEYYAHGYKGLEIERNIVFYYPLPLYFFVNKAQPKLALRVEKGMRILIDSGEYKRMFIHYFSDTIKLLKLPERTMIELQNPLITEQAAKQMLRDASFYKNLINEAYLLP